MAFGVDGVLVLVLAGVMSGSWLQKDETRREFCQTSTLIGLGGYIKSSVLTDIQ